MLGAVAPIEQPVALARALTGFGLGLAAAHDALNHLVAGEHVPVTLHLTPGGGTPFDLCRFGLSIGQPLDAAPEVFTLRNVTQEVRGAVESWRLSQPAQPPAGEAVDLILRQYLTEHGLLIGRDERQEARLYQTE